MAHAVAWSTWARASASRPRPAWISAAAVWACTNQLVDATELHQRHHPHVAGERPTPSDVAPEGLVDGVERPGEVAHRPPGEGQAGEGPGPHVAGTGSLVRHRRDRCLQPAAGLAALGDPDVTQDDHELALNVADDEFAVIC